MVRLRLLTILLFSIQILGGRASGGFSVTAQTTHGGMTTDNQSGSTFVHVGSSLAFPGPNVAGASATVNLASSTEPMRYWVSAPFDNLGRGVMAGWADSVTVQASGAPVALPASVRLTFTTVGSLYANLESGDVNGVGVVFSFGTRQGSIGQSGTVIVQEVTGSNGNVFANSSYGDFDTVSLTHDASDSHLMDLVCTYHVDVLLDGSGNGLWSVTNSLQAGGLHGLSYGDFSNSSTLTAITVGGKSLASQGLSATFASGFQVATVPAPAGVILFSLGLICTQAFRLKEAKGRHR